MKTIFLTSQIINERNYQRFSIQALEENSDLLIIDVTKLISKKIFEAQYDQKKNNLNIIYLDSLDDLKDVLLDSYNIDFLITAIGNINEDNFLIYDQLKPFQDKLCILALSGFPHNSTNFKNYFLNKLFSKIYREKSLRGLLKKLIYIMKFKLKSPHFIKTKYLISCGSEVTKQYANLMSNNTQIIKTCSYDYVLSKHNEQPLINTKYFVFLDENIIHHTDFYINNQSVDRKEIYYKELTRFLNFLSISYKVKIVVAAHPRANFEFTKMQFKNFEVVQGNTVNLVKHCEACITHASTSVNFAVIFKKPIIFATSDRMKLTRPDNAIISDRFGLIPINISDVNQYENVNEHLKINLLLYQDFLKKFISYSNTKITNYVEILKKKYSKA